MVGRMQYSKIIDSRPIHIGIGNQTQDGRETIFQESMWTLRDISPNKNCMFVPYVKSALHHSSQKSKISIYPIVRVLFVFEMSNGYFITET